MKSKVCHLTSVHNRYDNRIFYKMCTSLAGDGYNVSLVVADGLGDEGKNNVSILDVGRPKSRLYRMAVTTFGVLKKGLKTRSDIYHFHDPELMFIGLLLRMLGKRVVYDIHEDYVTSIAQKSYFPRWFRLQLARCFGLLERVVSLAFAKIIAEKYYAERFRSATPVLNYPLLEGLSLKSEPNELLELGGRYEWYLYTGNVTKDRGAFTHLNLLKADPKSAIAFIGYCPSVLYEQMMQHVRAENIETERVRLVGCDRYIPHEQINWYACHYEWKAGLALFPKTEHYRRKELTKFFEYMYGGLPILATDFEGWKVLVEQGGCGVCTDPDDPSAIRQAVEHLSRIRGGDYFKGCRARVEQEFNWSSQLNKLITLYEHTLEAG